MTRHLDPERSRPPRFWPFPIDIDTSVCDRCSALVPATDAAQQNHADGHAVVDALAAGFASVALASQLSGSGSRATASAGASAEPSPDPDVKSPPTPPQEATAGRGGAEGSNQGTDAAGVPLLPGSVTEAPDAPTSPGGSSGATKRVGRGSGGTLGDATGSAPADTTNRLHLVYPEPPDYGRFAR